MNKFALGALTALAFTTPEGRNISSKVINTGVKLGNSYLKNQLGIDVKQILADEETLERKDNSNEK